MELVETQVTLDDLALKHGTDKASNGHNYCPQYEQYLGHLRNTQPTLLELGVYEGASLRMWRDYFPRGTIVGLDINPLVDEIDGVDIHVGDQASYEDIETQLAIYQGFDVIIDDASHLSSLTIKSFELLYPHLKPGGLYVIEDLHSSYHDWFYGNAEACFNPDGQLPKRRGAEGRLETAMQFCKRLADEVNFKPGAEVHNHKWQLFPEKYWRGYHLESVQFFYNICFIRKHPEATWTATI